MAEWVEMPSRMWSHITRRDSRTGSSQDDVPISGSVSGQSSSMAARPASVSRTRERRRIRLLTSRRYRVSPLPSCAALIDSIRDGVFWTSSMIARG